MSRLIGNLAEDKACEFLQNKGYKILDRNYFARVGEIDIIAEKGNIICFVEVKDRGYDSYGGAASAITAKKLEKILKTAKIFLYENKLSHKDWQVDAVLIDGNMEPELLENIYVEGMS